MRETRTRHESECALACNRRCNRRKRMRFVDEEEDGRPF
jgi:RecG-like helicase